MSLLLRRRSSGTTQGGGAPPPPGPTDPDFANVQLLLGFNGSNGATSTSDESSVGRTISFVGSAALSTAQKKFGSASLLSATSSYVQTSSDSGFQFGTGKFTLEAWVYANSSPANTVIMDRWDNGTGLFNIILYCDASGRLAFGFRAAGANRFANDSVALSTGTWHHVAFTRDGTALQLYKNGSRVASFVISIGDSADYSASIALQIGEFWPGYIDEVRITKGVARYTGTTYTVPTAAFPRS